MSQFVFKHELTPSGRVIVKLFQGLEFIGVSLKAYDTGEEAHTDIRKAMDANHLEQVVRLAKGVNNGHA